MPLPAMQGKGFIGVCEGSSFTELTGVFGAATFVLNLLDAFGKGQGKNILCCATNPLSLQYKKLVTLSVNGSSCDCLSTHISVVVFGQILYVL